MRKFVSFFLAAMLMTTQLFAQEKTVTGKVTDESGNPIPNASVIVKGTNAGTSTLTDGSFSIKVPSGGRILVFSAVDMGTK